MGNSTLLVKRFVYAYHMSDLWFFGVLCLWDVWCWFSLTCNVIIKWLCFKFSYILTIYQMYIVIASKCIHFPIFIKSILIFGCLYHSFEKLDTRLLKVITCWLFNAVAECHSDLPTLTVDVKLWWLLHADIYNKGA